jgi:hypothetical protein
MTHRSLKLALQVLFVALFLVASTASALPARPSSPAVRPQLVEPGKKYRILSANGEAVVDVYGVSTGNKVSPRRAPKSGCAFLFLRTALQK